MKAIEREDARRLTRREDGKGRGGSDGTEAAVDVGGR